MDKAFLVLTCEARKKFHLEKQICFLINDGVDTFLSGGALGFDQVAATMVIRKKKEGFLIKLVFILPCKNQDKYWSERQKEKYKELLNEADEIVYISDEYNDDCMKLRNKKLVDSADICICALKNKYSGTAQTVKIAKEKGIKIINVLK